MRASSTATVFRGCIEMWSAQRSRSVTRRQRSSIANRSVIAGFTASGGRLYFSHRPNPRVNPNDHDLDPHFGHGKSATVAHSNVCKTRLITYPPGNANRNIAGAARIHHQPNPSGNRRGTKNVMTPAASPIWRNIKMPHVTPGRTPRPSSWSHLRQRYIIRHSAVTLSFAQQVIRQVCLSSRLG
jgi:hypothetical protein